MALVKLNVHKVRCEHYIFSWEIGVQELAERARSILKAKDNKFEYRTYHIKSPSLHAACCEFQVVVLANLMLDLGIGLI